MSSNFTGVTFAKQKIAPADDAIIRRAVLTDGILTGCALSYSGSTLTMAAGQLLVCGRQIKHPASQNWAVVDATSGFARILLTIDLTRTASKDVFDQVVDTIEYASSRDGFPALEQADVNASGVRYQVVLAVVSLGTGGITGIVSQLAASEASGGGGLNFKVVGGLTQPADPTENMLWVKTAAEITGYVIAASAPATAAEGTVMIFTGTASLVAFNALKKNQLMVYPGAVKMYSTGAWANMDASIYQDGKWTRISSSSLYIVQAGTIQTPPGFSTFGATNGALPTVTQGDGYRLITTTVNSTAVTTDSPISVNNRSTLYATINVVKLTASSTAQWKGVSLALLSGTGLANFTVLTQAIVQQMLAQTLGEHTLSVDVSSLTGEYYPAICVPSNGTTGSQVQVSNLWAV